MGKFKTAWQLIILLCMTVFVLTACSDTKNDKIDPEPNYYSTEYINIGELIASYHDIDFNLTYMSAFGSFKPDGQWMITTTGKITLTPEELNSDDPIIQPTEETSCVITYDPQSNQLHVLKLWERNEKGYKVYINYQLTRFFETMPDGNFVTIISNQWDYRSMPLEISRDCLAIFGRDGELKSEKLLYAIDSRIGSNTTANSYLYADDGYVYILSDTLLAILTPEGDLVNLFDLTKECLPFADGRYTYPTLIRDAENHSCIQFNAYQQENAVNPVFRIDATDSETPLRDAQVYPNYPESGDLYFAPGADAYLMNMYGIYAMETSEASAVRLLKWTDLSLSSINEIKILSQDLIYAIHMDPLTNERYLAILTRHDEPVIDTRKVINIAMEESMDRTGSKAMYARSELMKCAAKFNRENKDYRVNLVAYNTDEISTANEKLMRDIISGILPDMVLFGATISPEPFISAGVLQNMYDLMKGEAVYNKSAFLPCVLSPFESSHGYLPYLTLNFTLDTLVGSDLVLDDQSTWCVSDMQELADSLASDGKALIRVDKSDNPSLELLQMLLPNVLNDYIDYHKGTCRMDGEFANLVKLCGEAPLSVNDRYLYPREYISGNVATERMQITCARDLIQDQYALFSDNDAIYIGYPSRSANATGTAIQADMALAIIKGSDSAGGAWDFIKFYLDRQTTIWKGYKDRMQMIWMSPGFTPTYATTNAMFDTLSELIAYFSIYPAAGNDEQMLVSSIILNKPPSRESDEEGYLSGIRTMEFYEKMGAKPLYFTAENEAFLRGLFEDCTIVASRDEASMAIILEEASAYYAGTATLDAMVERIENRIKTRLNE